MAWWFYVKFFKKKAQLGSPLSCQPCGGKKTTIQFNTFCQVPQRNINKTKPHIYTDCTHFRRCIENKNTLVKQTDIVAKCIAIIWWLQHQQQQTNSESIIKPAPPVQSAQILFHTVLSRWRLGSITCPRTLDWRQLLRHFCRSDSHPEKQKRTSVSTTSVILNWVIGITNHSACQTFGHVTITQFQQQWPQHLINLQYSITAPKKSLQGGCGHNGFLTIWLVVTVLSNMLHELGADSCPGFSSSSLTAAVDCQVPLCQL